MKQKLFNVLRKLLFLEIVSVMEIQNKLFNCTSLKWRWGVYLINKLLRKLEEGGNSNQRDPILLKGQFARKNLPNTAYHRQQTIS